jgi:hypothetical protein
VLAVIVPAHHEEEDLDACLQSLLRAARWPALGGESVLFVVRWSLAMTATTKPLSPARLAARSVS